MELRQLAHFLAVVEAGSLTAAAERVGLTQQALSKSLSRLEDGLGGKLFERNARGMALSRLGETIVEHARQILAQAGHLQNVANAALGLKRGRLVVGLGPIAASGGFGKRVLRFSQKYPNVQIDIEDGIEPDFIARLNRGEIDVAISSQIGERADSVLLEQLALEKWGVAGSVANANLTAARTLQDLVGARWIIGRNAAQVDLQIASSFRNLGLEPPMPWIMTTSVLFTLQAIQASNCMAILPKSVCEGVEGVQWRDLDNGNWTTPLFLMRRKRAVVDDLSRAFLNEMRAA